ncbi:hypothetical protein HBE96_17395 [Clostridium sp. P21]|uniref:Hemolysin XhlA n=1 Tax=Clostridium muellerianum TaxID=2716538 RepID=A0A7Y0HR22_9CLOT|nr:hemolysin XhlA family protein [Clostridium muellerianum]NMM64398.1 hypothetical protein [Clostridium muellerianum]
MDGNSDVIQEILERLVRMETKLDDFTNLREKTDIAFTTSKQNEKDITEIKDNVKWCWRTTLGAIIIAAIGLFFKFH